MVVRRPKGLNRNSTQKKLPSQMVKHSPGGGKTMIQLHGVDLSSNRKKNDYLDANDDYSLRLSQEQERQMTHKIRSLRRAVRIRDALVQQREDWPATLYRPQPLSAYSDHVDDDDTDFPTERQWAEACGLSVLDLRRVMTEGQEARTILVSANAGLVTSIAKRHYQALRTATDAGGGVGTILTLQDMIQGELLYATPKKVDFSGCIYLIEASLTLFPHLFYSIYRG
jgi:hypothetical protein